MDGFSVDVFFPFPRGPLFSASIRGVGAENRKNPQIIQEVDLVEDFHGAVWRLPDGESATGFRGQWKVHLFFLVGPVVTEIFVSNFTIGFVLYYKEKCLNQKDVNDLFSQDSWCRMIKRSPNKKIPA